MLREQLVEQLLPDLEWLGADEQLAVHHKAGGAAHAKRGGLAKIGLDLVGVFVCPHALVELLGVELQASRVAQECAEIAGVAATPAARRRALA